MGSAHKDADKQDLRASCLRKLLEARGSEGGDTKRVGALKPEAVYVLAHFFAPFIPIAAEANCQFAAVGCEESET